MFPPCAGLSKMTLCGWKVSDAAVNIKKCAVKIKTAKRRLCRTTTASFHPDAELSLFLKSVGTDSDIERLSRLIVVLVRTGKGPDDFNCCPASHHILNAGFVQGCAVQQTVILFAWSRSIRSLMCSCPAFSHNFQK